MVRKLSILCGLLVASGIGNGFAEVQRLEQEPGAALETTAPEIREAADTAIVAGDTARVREAPSMGAEIIFRLKKDDAVNILNIKGDWYFIESEDGRNGWVHKRLFTRKHPPLTDNEKAKVLSEMALDAINATATEPEEKTDATDNLEKGLLSLGKDAITLNFPEIRIRSLLSALAIKQEINIVMAQEVTGKISVHLYQVTLDKALEAVTLAGGFRFRKLGDVYYVYKPEEKMDPHAERLRVRIFRLRYAEVEKIQGILASLTGIRMIQSDAASKTIVIEDTPENIKKVETIIRYWDAQPQQVMIEAKILEISLTDDMTLGVNWEQILGDARIGTGGFSTGITPTATGTSPVPSTGTGIFANLLTGAGTSLQFAAAIDALQTRTKINTLSTPKILAIHGKPATVQVGGQQGYKVTTTNLGVATETIQFIPTGTILNITPFIGDDGYILMKVDPSINAAKIEEGIPVVSSSRVSTWLLAKSGETAFIGGLIQNTKTRVRNTIPCLGDIPGLGLLFGRTDRGTGKSELVILITPRILDAEVKQKEREIIEKTKRKESEFQE